MSTPTGSGPVYDDEPVLRDINRMRQRILVRLSDDWPEIERVLDRLIGIANTLSVSRRETLLADLLRILEKSPVSNLLDSLINLEARSRGETTPVEREPPRKGWESEVLLKQLEDVPLPHRVPTGPRAKPPAPRPNVPKMAPEPSPEPSRAARPTRRGQAKKARSVGPKKGLSPQGLRKSAPSHTARPKTARAAKPEPKPMRSPTPKPATKPKPPKAKPRVVNLAFTNSQGRAVAAKRPLVVKQKYWLRVNIGPLAKDSVVKNAAANPVRTDLLPDSTEGYWLKVVAVSSRFKVSEVGRWLFLPTMDASWCCKCTPGGSHTCEPDARQPHLLLPVTAPETVRRAELRVTVYFQTAVVQSLLVTADIAQSPQQRGSHRAVVDYNLTNRLTDLGGLEPRAMSVMTNDSDDGTHRIVFNGARDKPVTITLTDDQMTAAITAMRTIMRDIHLEKIGNANPKNLFDAKNAKKRDIFIADLRKAALQGAELWTAVWQDPDEWTNNETAFTGPSDVIQIARKQSSTAVFPWAMVYSIPLETGAPENTTLCKLVGDENEWKKFQASADSPVRCPFEETHAEGVICPYGFWGVRYQIEQPPSLKQGRPRIGSIPAVPVPLDCIVALSDELDAGLLTTHLDALRALAPPNRGFKIQECHTRANIRKGLETRDLELAYFYCHGLTIPLPGNAGIAPALGVGIKQVIKPPDLVTWMRAWAKDHWNTVAPLVFINGCHTADTTPQTLVNFVDTFSTGLKAAGVIGTEITLHQLVANEVGEVFLRAFQRGKSVGESLRQARASLLRKGNLLGLVYTAYCSADLKLSASIV
jgi:hypothetical protein